MKQHWLSPSGWPQGECFAHLPASCREAAGHLGRICAKPGFWQASIFWHVYHNYRDKIKARCDKQQVVATRNHMKIFFEQGACWSEKNVNVIFQFLVPNIKSWKMKIWEIKCRAVLKYQSDQMKSLEWFSGATDWEFKMYRNYVFMKVQWRVLRTPSPLLRGGIQLSLKSRFLQFWKRQFELI